MKNTLVKYDFDKQVDRKNTWSLKYDFAERKGKPHDVIPMWVADMDFQTAPEIIEALKEKSEYGIFGYAEPTDDFYADLIAWYKRRFDYDTQRSWYVLTPGVVFAIATVIKALTKEGDAVLIQRPVYYPFAEVVEDSNRKLVNNALQYNGKYYEIDFDDFEQQIIDNDVKLFLFCSPHNPVSRVWTLAELKKIADICHKHNVIVVADEIHADFIYGENKHTVFAKVDERLKDNVIVISSTSKTFNLAALQLSQIIVQNKGFKHAIKKELDKAGYSQCNIMGLVATQAAYKHGEAWLEALLEYLQENIRKFTSFIEERLPQLKVIKPEGTYLVWVDFRALGLSEKAENDLVTNKAKLWLDDGLMFGPEGKGFQRFNIACPWSTIEKALLNLEKAIKELS